MYISYNLNFLFVLYSAKAGNPNFMGEIFIYLRDGRNNPMQSTTELLKVCDLNNIPYATNIATAEILILAIDRGDLDWREWVKNQ
mgnify:CR=1 FL=1